MSATNFVGLHEIMKKQQITVKGKNAFFMADHLNITDRIN